MAPKSLAESAKSNPTALGDPVSLKAENSDTQPTKNDRPNKSSSQSKSKANPDLNTIAPAPTEGDKSEKDGNSKKSLKDVAEQDLQEAKKGNRSMLGDPVSLKAEKSEKDPIPDDGRGTITGNKGRDSKL